ncbi:hypothetical protein M0804_006701 [Polistes exclamans]|nr:hypothetical protein M0804_006701 [Polistes exclamans]
MVKLLEDGGLRNNEQLMLFINLIITKKQKLVTVTTKELTSRQILDIVIDDRINHNRLIVYWILLVVNEHVCTLGVAGGTEAKDARASIQLP